jgi:hypothetical protein
VSSMTFLLTVLTVHCKFHLTRIHSLFLHLNTGYINVTSATTFGPENEALLLDAMCPLTTLHFFDKRNHCDCLKDVYKYLKSTTSRTVRCFGCSAPKSLKKLRSVRNATSQTIARNNASSPTGHLIRKCASSGEHIKRKRRSRRK